eukprot:g6242.t1
MTSSNALWCIVFVFAFVFTFVKAEVTLSDFSGVWFSSVEAGTVNFFTPQGQGLVCRDAVSAECDAELTPVEFTFIFNEKTLWYETRDRVGITDVNKSAATHPSCAKEGIFPSERVVKIPPNKIASYDSDAEKIYFIDPRRPDDVNCMTAKYRVSDNGPYFELMYVAVYNGSVKNIFERGISFSCKPPPLPCRVAVDDKGNLDFILLVHLNFTCSDGDCLNVPFASVPSTSIEQKESAIDV